jgi:hypothetical protein
MEQRSSPIDVGARFIEPGYIMVEDIIKEKPAHTGGWSGDVLFSHGVAPTVSSGLKSLTAVFGMGTGVSSSL